MGTPLYKWPCANCDQLPANHPSEECEIWIKTKGDEMTYKPTDTEQLEARLKSLVVIASLVLDDLNDSDTGWYYQFQREIQLATQLVNERSKK